MSRALAADDPLAGILSDASDDSFFDEPKNPIKKPASPFKAPEKKSASDLLDLLGSQDEKGKKKANLEEDWFGLDRTASKSHESGFETERTTSSGKLTKKISFEDDMLGSLGLTETDNPTVNKKDEPSKKSNLLESILGDGRSNPKKVVTLFDNPRKESSKTVQKPVVADFKPQSANEPFFQPSGVSSDLPREGRRERKPSSGLLDPLGLFSSEKTPPRSASNENLKSLEEQRSRPTTSVQKSKSQDSALPDWLGGSGASTGTSLKPPEPSSLIKQTEQRGKEKQSTDNEEIKTQVQSLPANFQAAVSESNTNYTSLPIVPVQDNQLLTSFLTQQKLVHTNMEYQNSTMALQQQESQLLMAIYLKKYEENLSSIQQQQQELLLKQEQQFNQLLERQFEKQQIMENNMKLQQERINNHIKLLISHPSSAQVTSQTVTKVNKQENEEENKIEEENTKYEQILSSLKQRQHEELFLLEESYKKQITLLEQSIESLESHLKSDLTKLSKDYEIKLKKLETENENLSKKAAEKLKSAEEDHIDEINKMRENYSRIIDEIKYEHSTIIETIKQSKQSEGALFKDATVYSEKLDTTMQSLSRSSNLLDEIREKVHKDYNILSVAREESLKIKEQEIRDMREALDKCRESAESERAQLMTLVRTLEIKLSEQHLAGKEERWALQQAAATLAARSSALDRETEYNKTSIEREREQLKTLKESLLAEQETAILHLTEEKLALSAEKSKLETSHKLSFNFDQQKAKVEIEAALKVAQDAAKLAENERDKLVQQQTEIEAVKRALKEKERSLLMRERDLMHRAQIADQRSHDAEKRLHEARLIETQYNEKYNDLQNKLASLSGREKKLHEEKIALSKERLVWHTMMRQNRRCGLCEADAQSYNETKLSEVSRDLLRVKSQTVDPRFMGGNYEEDDQNTDVISKNLSL